MYVFNTEIHIVSFIIIIIELFVLFFQAIHFLQRTSDKSRLRYLILLLLLIQYNVLTGLFPDPNIPIPTYYQNITAYLVSFTVVMYFAYYIYRTYQLAEIKILSTSGTIYFLFIPFLVFFVLTYLISGNLDLSRKAVVIIPFFYGVAFVFSLTKALKAKYKTVKEFLNYDHISIISIYIGVVLWAILPIIVFLGSFQVLAHLVTNIGFLFLTVAYIRSTVITSKYEYSMLTKQKEELHYLEVEISEKRIELANITLQHTQRLNTLNKLKSVMLDLDPKVRNEFSEVVHIIKDGLAGDEQWRFFFQSFNKSHNGFYNQLKTTYPDLSEKELRNLSLIKLGMNSEEIAQMLGVKSKSLRQMRYRTKKKMKLDEELDLVGYLDSL